MGFDIPSRKPARRSLLAVARNKSMFTGRVRGQRNPTFTEEAGPMAYPTVAHT